MAWRYFTPLTTCSALAAAVDSASHARLTRLLQGPWSGPTRRDLACRALFAVAGGSRLVDAPGVAKPAARLLGEAAWVWSHKERQGLFGVSVVLLVWTDGQHRVPRACRVWHKGGVATYALARDLLSSARQRLQCQPAGVLFDSWSPSTTLRKRLRDDGWDGVCPLKKKRSGDGTPVRASRQPPYGQAVGTLSGGLQGLVVRYRRQSYAPNRLTVTAPAVRAHYQQRHAVEEVMRVLKSHRGLEGGPVG